MSLFRKSRSSCHSDHSLLHLTGRAHCVVDSLDNSARDCFGDEPLIADPIFILLHCELGLASAWKFLLFESVGVLYLLHHIAVGDYGSVLG